MNLEMLGQILPYSKLSNDLDSNGIPCCLGIQSAIQSTTQKKGLDSLSSVANKSSWVIFEQYLAGALLPRHWTVVQVTRNLLEITCRIMLHGKCEISPCCKPPCKRVIWAKLIMISAVSVHVLVANQKVE